ncbi:diguanylate cyclase [Xanthomonas citri]|nr:diguanylate cyclase [Xanthomonas citri]
MSYWRRLFFVAIAVSFCKSSFAQEMSIRLYGKEDGLRDLDIGCLVEDAVGTLWVCANTGLHRFNGSTFERIGEESGVFETPIQNYSPDVEGRGGWITTGPHIYRWDGDRATKIVVNDKALRTAGHGDVIQTEFGALAEIGMQLQFIQKSNSGWSVQPAFNVRTLSLHPELKKVRAVRRIGDEQWFNCGEIICRRGKAGSLQVYGPAQGVLLDRWGEFVRDGNGAIWTRSGNGVVLMLPANSETFVQSVMPVGIGVSLPGRQALAEDGQGRILLRTDRGLLRWNDGLWEQLDHRHGLPDAPVDVVATTRDGDVWIARAGAGVFHLRGYGRVENWGYASGLRGAPTWAMARSGDGAIYLGNHSGLYRFDSSRQRMRPLSGPFALNEVAALAGDEDGIWAGLFDGRVLRMRQGGQLHAVATVASGLRRIFVDTKRRMWLCTEDGVWTLDGPNGSATRNAQLPDGRYYDVGQDSIGRLWFAGSAGLFVIDNRRNIFRVQADGDLPNQTFDKVAITSDGQVWVSVDSVGVFRGYLKPGYRVTFKAVNHPLLRDEFPYLLRQDSRGWLWIGSSGGLDVTDGSRWVHLDRNNGLLSEDISENAFLEDADGSIWIGTALGATRIADPSTLFNSTPIRLEITSVTRGGDVASRGQVLPWAKLPVRMRLATPGSVTSPDLVKFRYRLLGRQDDWIETTSRTIDFATPGSGALTIEVQAMDLGRDAYSKVESFIFGIKPPWWKSDAAIMVWLSMGVLLCVGVWKRRVRHLLIREQQLEALVAQRTSELATRNAALEEARATLHEQAIRDGLTGLFNRAYIVSLLNKEVSSANRSRVALAIAMFDLDHFKSVNDTYGHPAGDTVLRTVASRLTENIRAPDQVGRYGGEELLAIMPGLQPPASARLSDLLASVAGRPIELDGGIQLVVTSSIGIAWLRPSETAAELLRRADKALYKAT